MRQLQQRLKRVRMLICDVDGVMTDGRLWVDGDGKWRRFFHVKDGVGMKLLMDDGYKVGVISGGKSEDVILRLGFLNINYTYLDIPDKTISFTEILKQTGFQEDEIAYIGDEVFDIPIISRVGVGVTVPNAVQEVKDAALYVTDVEGGKGAVRELADLIRRYGAFSQTSPVQKKSGRRKTNGRRAS